MHSVEEILLSRDLPSRPVMIVIVLDVNNEYLKSLRGA